MFQLTYSDRKDIPGRPHPNRVGRYQLIGKLASGGMAEAYLALSGELPALRSLVVVKRILPHLSSQEQFVRMFLDEARIGALLDHPNIVRIIEVGSDGDGYFLAMEPVQGKPLSAVLRRAAGAHRPLGQAQAAFILGQAANGLGYAHALTDAAGCALNIVHRDISPQNILVSFDGTVKVIDFGVASALGRITETIPGGLKGKIEYMSPEQAAGDSADRRSDIFALGVVLWEALCGRRLFRRRTELETMRAIFDEPIPRPPRSASVPARLENLVMRALERDPADRFQDAREMATLLQQHAFRSAGFDLLQLGAQMKSLFPADYAGWKAAATAGLHIETKRTRKITASFSLTATPDSRTAERTVALQAGGVPELPQLPSPESEPVDSGRLSGERSAPSDGRPSRSSLWVAGSVLLLALVLVAGHFVFPRSPPMSVAAVWPASPGKAPMIVVPISPAEPPRVEGPTATQAVSPQTNPTSPVAAAPEPAPSSPLVQRATVHVRNTAVVPKADPRRRVAVRRAAETFVGKRKVAVTQRKSTPATATKVRQETTVPRPPWHDPFD